MHNISLYNIVVGRDYLAVSNNQTICLINKKFYLGTIERRCVCVSVCVYLLNCK